MGLFDGLLGGGSDKSSHEASLEITTERSSLHGTDREVGVLRDSSGREVGRGSVESFKDALTGGSCKTVDISGERFRIE